MNWFTTDQACVGYLPADRLLVYATGGLAFGSFRGELSSTPLFVGPLFGSWSHIGLGWTVGGGVEAAYDQNWFVKLEYLYMDLGKLVGRLERLPPLWLGGADDNRQKLHVQLALYRQYILGWGELQIWSVGSGCREVSIIPLGRKSVRSFARLDGRASRVSYPGSEQPERGAGGC